MSKGAFPLGYKWIYYLIAVALIISTFMFFRGQIQNAVLQPILCTDDIENNIIITKSLYSDCFVYHDKELIKNIPGTIDIAKFTQDNFDHCFNEIDQDVQIKIGSKTLGNQITESVKIKKLARVYDNNQITLELMEFNFPKSQC